MSRSDNTPWKKQFEVPYPEKDRAWYHGKYHWRDIGLPRHRGKEIRRFYWKTQRSATRLTLLHMDLWLDDDPPPSRTRSTARFWYYW
jgi:hypothetical protein